MVNLRTKQDSSNLPDDSRTQGEGIAGHIHQNIPEAPLRPVQCGDWEPRCEHQEPSSSASTTDPASNGSQKPLFGARKTLIKSVQQASRVLFKFAKFIGPGFMIAVAYIDPGNYSTDVTAGAATRFKLLFIVFMSNVFAIVLQSLAVRLGTVTGLNLAEHCRAHLPRWLNITLYIMGEAAIIATDIAEVSSHANHNDSPLGLIRRTGHRLRHSTEPAAEGAAGSRLCDHNR